VPQHLAGFLFLARHIFVAFIPPKSRLISPKDIRFCQSFRHQLANDALLLEFSKGSRT
jgi:hypothetical protein